MNISKRFADFLARERDTLRIAGLQSGQILGDMPMETPIQVGTVLNPTG